MAAQDKSSGATTLVDGIVIDSRSKAPIIGVSVKAMGQGNPSTITNSEGRFILENVKAGRVILSASKSGYIPTQSAYVLKPQEQIRGVPLELSVAGVISGQLIDSKGSPIVNGTVHSLYSWSAADGQRELLTAITTTTDDRGNYRLFPLAPGEYLIDFANKVGWLDSPSNPSFIDPQKEPPRGQAKVPPFLYPGVVEISNATPVSINVGEEVKLGTTVLPQARLGAISFHFRTPTSEAKSISFRCCIPPNFVNLLGKGGADFFLGNIIRVEPGTDFVMRYWPIQPGTYIASTSWKNGISTTETKFEFVEFGGTDIDVPIILGKPEGRLTVRAILESSDGGKVPSSGLKVGLGGASSTYVLSSSEPQEPPLRSVFRTTQDDGIAEFEGISVGHYTLNQVLNLPPNTYLAGIRQGERDLLEAGIDVSSESKVVELRIRFGPGRIRGEVSDTFDFAHNALVVLIPASPFDASAISRFRQAGRTDQFGSFEFSGIAPGRYRLYVWSSRDFPFSTDDITYSRITSELLKSVRDRSVPIEVKEKEEISVKLQLPN
jgi:hypothetical protein